MRRIRVALVIDEITSPTAGTERQLLHLAEGLDLARFSPLLCLLRSSPWAESYRGCPVHALGLCSFRTLSGWLGVWGFARFLREQGIDILQCHFRDATLAGVAAATLARGVWVVGTRRNQGYWMDGRELALARFLNRGVDRFVANSLDTKDWAVTHEGIAPGRITVIHNGLDAARFAEAAGGRERVRRELGLSGTDVAVVAVANLRPVKRLDLVVEAAAKVAAKAPGARFFIVGEGGERAKLEKQADSLGLVGKVAFLGRREDVPGLLAAMDIGVLSSDSESFSNALLEYMAAGLPAVCTDVGGCREAVRDGVTGSVVPKGDAAALAAAIEGYCRSAELRRRAGEAGQARAAEKFSMQRFVEAHQELYLSLAGERQ